MANKITHAPQSVIDELNGNAKLHSPLRVLKHVEQNFFPETKKWVLANEGSENESKQVAIVNHASGYKELLPEREPEYLVLDHGGYFYLENGVLKIDNALNSEPSDYQGQGMTKDQAGDLVHAFSGEIVEIPEPEDETRWYVDKGSYCIIFGTNEDDIMQFDTGRIGVVGFDRGTYIIAHGLHATAVSYALRKHNAIVIGNVHEHPELLEGVR